MKKKEKDLDSLKSPPLPKFKIPYKSRKIEKEVEQHNKTYRIKPSVVDSKFFWVAPLSFIGISFISWIIIFIRSKIIGSLGLPEIIWIIFSILVSFIAGIMLIIKLVVSSRKLKQKWIELTNNNYIIQHFLTNTGRFLTINSPIAKDGVSITSIPNKLYIVDKDACWFDEKKRPHGFWYPELPNQIKLSSKKAIQKHLVELANRRATGEYTYNSIENDIAFSSDNLLMFKNNKVMHDANKNESKDMIPQTTFTTIGFMMGAIIIMLIVVIIVMAVTRGSGGVPSA